MYSFTIRRARPEDRPGWLRMRLLLWPSHTVDELLAEMDQILANPDEQPVFIAFSRAETGATSPADHSPGGFLEGGTRKYADGCNTSPVGYIEGWYVDEDLRRKGAGRALIFAMEAWARENGLAEIASDTWLDNETSITAHKKLGYVEMERLVHFAKKL
jgi:aminoglycoside 6'-N-acetyltransferase I